MVTHIHTFQEECLAISATTTIAVVNILSKKLKLGILMTIKL